ncbi:MAG TPA: DUF1003 domain-containing protein [bacterium]|nr:DUF1003 domain-containing protein [bacterium]
MRPNAPVQCGLCHKTKKVHETVPAELVRPGVADAIKKEHPEWEPNGFVCLHDLNHFRGKFVQEVLEDERGKLSQMEEQVVKSLEEQEAISQNLNEEFDRNVSFGERIADRVAEFGGSWSFIIFFGVVMLAWIAVNTILMTKPFDPAPFIGLNLILSMLAALQAPVIMMSQNRQDAKDRLRADHDFRTNLKAELEVRHLNAKMDLLLTHQWQRLLEIQRIQMELMQELANAKRSAGVKVVGAPPPKIETETLMAVDRPEEGSGASIAAEAVAPVSAAESQKPGRG